MVTDDIRNVIRLVPKPRRARKPAKPSPAPLGPSIVKRGPAYLFPRLGEHLRWLMATRMDHRDWHRVDAEVAELRKVIWVAYGRRFPGRNPSDQFLDGIALKLVSKLPW